MEMFLLDEKFTNICLGGVVRLLCKVSVGCVTCVKGDV
mgnify:FL=1